MPSHEELEMLKRHVEALIPEQTLEAAADDAEAPMRMGETQPIKRSEAKRAQAALQKLASSGEIDDEEAFLIEAIILPDKRPTIDIIDGTYSIGHPLWVSYNTDPNIRSNIERAIRGVGRIDIPDDDNRPYAGTGYLVGGNLMMTNRHVAELFANGLGRRNLSFQSGQSAVLDFKREVVPTPPQPIRVNRIAMIHPYWDMALLELEDLPPGAEALTLSQSDPEGLVNRDIAVIGYPGFDARNPADVQHKVFRGTYYVKRLQPGKLKARAPKKSFNKIVSALTHDASTLGGNSGSPVLDVQSGEVVALHFAGRYKDKNFAVPIHELSRDDRVIAEALEFGEDAGNNVVDPNPWQSYWTTADGQDESAHAAASAADPGGTVTTPVATRSNRMSVTIPVTVTVEIGETANSDAATLVTGAPAAIDIERMVEPAHSVNYSNRLGYDPEFVSVTVPMPTPNTPDILSKLDDGSHLLDYVHFSLAMNKSRRLAQFTAANVDTRPERLKPEPGRDYTRRGLNGYTSPNDRERWFTDPRIPAQHQLPDRFFTKDRTAFDKGHVVRRNAVVWGDSYREVQNANGDTFHVTNCSPQVKGFNRSGDGGLWGKLENVVFKQAKSNRLCVFAGPVLKADDPVFSGVDDDGQVNVRIPRAYWKVIVAAKDCGLQCYGFRLEQDLSDVDFELQFSGAWVRRMTALPEIQNVADITFPETVLAGDQYSEENAEAIASAIS